MKKILLSPLLLTFLQQEAGAQYHRPPDKPFEIMERAFASRNTDATARTNNALVHQTITDLGEIAEGQIYQFKASPTKGHYYPQDYLYVRQSDVSSISIPESSGISSVSLSANNQFIVTLDTKDRYGDYSQQFSVATAYGNLVFVVNAHIVDAGVLKAATVQKKTDLQ
ncbi:hypothetical protein [Taibaiella helva]|uniref:hypothetical protein n=1 Tax=Taibaiella helva TaxID=2301235 RepID=UPI000E56D254|nr:hypothetical protein [Taibaiella helva]